MPCRWMGRNTPGCGGSSLYARNPMILQRQRVSYAGTKTRPRASQSGTQFLRPRSGRLAAIGAFQTSINYASTNERVHGWCLLQGIGFTMSVVAYRSPSAHQLPAKKYFCGGFPLTTVPGYWISRIDECGHAASPR